MRIAAEATASDHPAHEWVKEHYEGVENWLTDAVRTGIARGEFAADTPVDFLVRSTIAILDGKPIGAVPKKDYAVSPGSHTILFINSEKNLRKSITVNVADGESKPAFTKLEDQ